jgi:solute carrier family 35 (UDP-sugar transporter), member A1/2/3
MAPSKSTTTTTTTTTAPTLDGRALFYMFLLALQFGFQPSLTRQFTPPGINTSTVVLVQEVIKFVFAATMLRLSCSTQQLVDLYQKWTWQQWFQVAAIPAGLYAIQNVAALTAYQHLDALTFNVLNQTKTLSAAFCCYVVMGRTQSPLQIAALLLLLLSALIMEGVVPIPGASSPSKYYYATAASSTTTTTPWDTQHVTHGVIPILVASFISGLAGALSQKNLQATEGGGRNPYLFSMELCAASAIMLGMQLLAHYSSSSATTTTTSAVNKLGMWERWTLGTLIPISTNAAGGIVVGLVTKYAGSVRKGFALIFGILISGLVQEFVTKPQQQQQQQGNNSTSSGIRPEQIVGGLLAAVSLYCHALPSSRSSSTKKRVKEEQQQHQQEEDKKKQ